eukprot:tig00020961_g16690.t1
MPPVALDVVEQAAELLQQNVCKRTTSGSTAQANEVAASPASAGPLASAAAAPAQAEVKPPAETKVRLNIKMEGDASPCAYTHIALSATLAELRAQLHEDSDVEILKHGFVLHDAPASAKQEESLRVSDVFPCVLLRKLRKERPAPPKPAKAEDKDKEEEEEDVPPPFKLVREKVKMCNGEEVERQFMVITDHWLRNELRRHVSLSCLYDNEPKICPDELLFHFPTLRDAKTCEPKKWKQLTELLAKEFEEGTRRAEAMIAEGAIAFNTLFYLFPKGTRVVASSGDDTLGFEVSKVSYNRGWCRTTFLVEGELIKSNGRFFFRQKESFSIGQYDGARTIKDLPLQPLDAATEARLTERGRLFRRIGLGAHYMMYKGTIQRRGWWSSTHFKADGRVMVDGRSFKLFNPNYSGFESNDGEEAKIEDVPEEKLWTTHHSVAGFSFSCKKWGELLLRDISDIQFDEEAFGRLVLEETKKEMIAALVKNSEHTFSDIISGKGGGCIFLLHGAPGTGKTLTAEAISELLHRPLYSVSVGELGTTTSELEQRLREILEVAQAWNAVILIDEADIFLERRTLTDVKRNAMVGIFLRLLEYHQGVLFLTTNRVSAFDQAFHSRISVALKYAPLDAEARGAVWRTLLQAAGVEGLDPAALARHDLNGRQIKNTIRLAQSLARAQGRPVSPADVESTIAVAAQFQSDILDHTCDLSTPEGHI